MVWAVHLGFSRVFSKHGPPARTQDVPQVVRADLQAHAERSEGRRQLVELTGTDPRIAMGELVELAVQMIESGRLGFSLHGFPRFTSAPHAVESAVPLAESSSELTPRYAVAIKLIGEDDRPLPGLVYRLLGPDGFTRTGRLDQDGQAEIRDLEVAGECEVCFPDLDESAWERVDSVSL